MKLIAGVDIGNSTTEVCIGAIEDNGRFRFLSSASRMTTGTKGTLPNVHGIKAALTEAMERIHEPVERLSLIRLNEAAPVIGDTAMETITETIITESSMIGHNPSTPAGAGEAVGRLIFLENLWKGEAGAAYIVAVSNRFSYEEAAARLNQFLPELDIRGLILQADEAVLVENRLNRKMPIVDEVKHITRIPEGKLAAIEVALPGTSVRMLSNPYGIATLLGLDAQETKAITPIAKSLVGKRSAVVIRTPHGNMRENILPAGEIHLKGEKDLQVNIDAGADVIMEAVAQAGEIQDITGQDNTNVGNMLKRIKNGMAEVAGSKGDEIRITDILAVDTLAPVEISGSLAGETCMEKAVGIAAMVKTQHLPMQQIADRLEEELHVKASVAGVEAVMASLGAMTTPGTRLPLAILDMGGGSTDAAVLEPDGSVRTTHQAGAGELVSMLIQTELGLGSRVTAEQIKKYPMGKVESLFHMRLENGAMQFFPESIDPRYFGHVVLLAPGEMLKIEEDIPMERILEVRQDAKKKVFVRNAIRALRTIAPGNDLKNIPNVVLVGGSAEDFEIPEMLMAALSEYRIVCGRGNIRGTEGPRNAVATGLLMSYLGEKHQG
ncbi:diol dehydratase reactivase subunit alpha [Blautia ammoniilytica]|uniref:Diol dehydratase reactivase subunit alpha n=1 Tax=Blautia ammoniilytica TaxID=2981782 RepID=A0ABT2TNR1_9FIRM|nr:diol dehydratase reactivase subunit alpha [Blautia ammoniilytica]MCU6763855.1 diol dehydratase reactivase subunit alpha [Blautia ammoniilytica]SCG95991.1 Diol dehydratase-reactivating factor large subunit [uncultured Blautia sp.]